MTDSYETLIAATRGEPEALLQLAARLPSNALGLDVEVARERLVLAVLLERSTGEEVTDA